MIVLKFGGTSVANAQNIQLAINIVSDKSKKEKAVVVSALSGVTDMLLIASQKAASKDENYKNNIEEIKQKHFDTISLLIESNNQNQLLIKINSQINQLQTLLDGCYLLGELSPRTSDAIASFGELYRLKLSQRLCNKRFRTAILKTVVI
jgi:aspartokinase/homoserine dehydrogenase 1